MIDYQYVAKKFVTLEVSTILDASANTEPFIPNRMDYKNQ